MCFNYEQFLKSYVFFACKSFFISGWDFFLYKRFKFWCCFFVALKWFTVILRLQGVFVFARTIATMRHLLCNNKVKPIHRTFSVTYFCTKTEIGFLFVVRLCLRFFARHRWSFLYSGARIYIFWPFVFDVQEIVFAVFFFPWIEGSIF